MEIKKILETTYNESDKICAYCNKPYISGTHIKEKDDRGKRLAFPPSLTSKITNVKNNEIPLHVTCVQLLLEEIIDYEKPNDKNSRGDKLEDTPHIICI